LVGPSSDQQVTETVTVDLGADVISRPTATVTAAACIGPPEPPPVTFTFTKTASAASAMVGAVITYKYCGQNTSDIPLEVTRLVDDRLGVVIELPDVDTIVQPGQTLCNTDINEPVTYTVKNADAGTTILDNAVVTVRDPANPTAVFQATAQATVDVPQLPDPPPEPPTTTVPGSTLPSTGSNSGSTATWGVVFLLLGITATVISRRPRLNRHRRH
jgi:LPXTG-motif cell wall-anchored protein